MLVLEPVEVKWNGKTKKWYTDKGYSFTKIGDTFMVTPTDLTKGSHVKVKVKCDYCENELMKTYKSYLRQSDNGKDVDCCKDCQYIKSQRNCLNKYGVKNPMQIDSVKSKQQHTLLERYGVDSPMKSEILRNKQKENNIHKYGVPHYSQTKEWKSKIEKTSIKNFGVSHFSKSKVVREKVRNTMFKNGTSPTSTQQNYIHSVIGGKLNYPVSRSSLDIAFPSSKIYVEYDGGGHKLPVKLGNMTQDEFNKREKRRTFSLLDIGWKEIRIISDNDKLPTDNLLIKYIECSKMFLNTKGYSVRWDVNTEIVETNYKNKWNINEFIDKLYSEAI